MYRFNSKKIYLAVSLTIWMLAGNVAFAQSGEPSPVSSSPQIVFTGGKWKDIEAEAKKKGKYIFVDAYASWCAPCRQLKNVTFKDKDAAAYFNDNFINYTADMENGEGVELAGKWEITAYPTLLFFNPEGKIVMKQVGYVDGKELIEFGRQALDRK